MLSAIGKLVRPRKRDLLFSEDDSADGDDDEAPAALLTSSASGDLLGLARRVLRKPLSPSPGSTKHRSMKELDFLEGI